MQSTLPVEGDREFSRLAKELQDYMQSNAPWNDRTGDARANLKAIYRGGGSRFVIELQHGVPYGKFLEFGTVHMEPRPILRPTMDSAVGRAAKSMGYVLIATFRS